MDIVKMKLYGEVKKLWFLGCDFDNIDPLSSFVVWSDGNPFVDSYNGALNRVINYQHHTMMNER